MRHHAFLLAATLAFATLGAAMPAATAADELCRPVADETATPLVTPAGTLYVKTMTVDGPRGIPVPLPTQLWEESNGIAGLQPSSHYACDGAPDLDRADLTFAF